MNLPSYSLSDSPPSTILNVCLAISPYTNHLESNSTHPVSQPSQSKGKARAVDQHSSQTVSSPASPDEDDWEDAEYRNTRLKTPLARSSAHQSGHPIPSSQADYSRCTGWDEIFATANTEGWVIYGIHPLRVIHKHHIPNASLLIVLPLHRTNIIFLVGGPPSPLYSPNKVVIYDSSISQPISSIEFSSPVLGLTARRDKLVVVLLNRVILFNLSPGHDRAVEQEGEWDTCDNPKGLVSLATHPASTLLIFPGRQFGQVQVVQLPGFDPYQASAPPVHPPRQAPYPTTTILLAHTTALAALTITPNGQLIATASVTGTLIRVWDAKTSKLVHELRRGTDGAAVWSLRFRPDGLAICASSDKGTIHLWHLLNPNPTTHGTKKPSLESDSISQQSKKTLSLLKPYLPKYFHSAWSDGFFRLPAPAPAPSRSLPNLFAGADTKEDISKPPTIEDDVSILAWVLTQAGAQMVVLTRSGGWYRLAAGDQSGGRTSQLGGLGQEKSIEMTCVEYRRFGEGDDGWSDEED